MANNLTHSGSTPNTTRAFRVGSSEIRPVDDAGTPYEIKRANSVPDTGTFTPTGSYRPEENPDFEQFLDSVRSAKNK
jgi:hypothetical protein